MNIPFNKPYLSGKELYYIARAVGVGHISGNGYFTKQCHRFFREQYAFKKVLLTNSCTAALEMSALLANITVGDEVIMPSYTFVSTANAFVLRGAKIVFADSMAMHPNMNVARIEALITPKTKAIVVMHYAGMACDMDAIMELAAQYNLVVIEDAAQCVGAKYKDKALGGIGHLGTFSFHETKNIMAGEGGLLAINRQEFEKRAEIIWEKGTNRAAFFRGEVDKYGWMDLGSSYLPSELTAAFLYAQLENSTDINEQRQKIWNNYFTQLQPLAQQGFFDLPQVPKYAAHNAHIFYLVCKNLAQRSALINYLKSKKIHTVFHYLPLHQSPFFANKHDGRNLPNSQKFADCLLRLPFFYELTEAMQAKIIGEIRAFFLMTNYQVPNSK